MILLNVEWTKALGNKQKKTFFARKVAKPYDTAPCLDPSI